MVRFLRHFACIAGLSVRGSHTEDNVHTKRPVLSNLQIVTKTSPQTRGQPVASVQIVMRCVVDGREVFGSRFVTLIFSILVESLGSQSC